MSKNDQRAVLAAKNYTSMQFSISSPHQWSGEKVSQNFEFDAQKGGKRLGLSFALFSVFNMDVPQVSTGFFPFQLLYGRHPRGLLDRAKRDLGQESTPHRNVIQQIAQMQDRITAVMLIVREHMQQAQEAQARICKVYKGQNLSSR